MPFPWYLEMMQLVNEDMHCLVPAVDWRDTDRIVRYAVADTSDAQSIKF